MAVTVQLKLRCLAQPANSFVAKDVCNMREYEYLLPLDLVHDEAKGLSEGAKQDLMAKLNKVGSRANAQ